MTRELLFSVTAKDCRWDYYRGPGSGGQKMQKTKNAARCTHKASGAMGQAHDHRSKERNRRLAFKRMFKTKKFQDWLKFEAARVTGAVDAAERYAEREINSDRVRVEVKKDGKWTPEEP